MTFVEGFYSFSISLTNTDRDQYEKVRFKTAKHPHESFELLTARVLAYMHCYRVGLEFSQGLFNVKEPTMWSKDVIGGIELWAEVGVPEQKKLLKALREHRPGGTEYYVYFYHPDQIEAFCMMLRGSKSNWVKDVQFFEIDAGVVERIIPTLSTSQSWQITVVDNALYLYTDEAEFETTIAPVAIWDRFQSSIDNPLPPKVPSSS